MKYHQADLDFELTENAEQLTDAERSEKLKQIRRTQRAPSEGETAVWRRLPPKRAGGPVRRQQIRVGFRVSLKTKTKAKPKASSEDAPRKRGPGRPRAS